MYLFKMARKVEEQAVAVLRCRIEPFATACLLFTT